MQTLGIQGLARGKTPGMEWVKDWKVCPSLNVVCHARYKVRYMWNITKIYILLLCSMLLTCIKQTFTPLNTYQSPNFDWSLSSSPGIFQETPGSPETNIALVISLHTGKIHPISLVFLFWFDSFSRLWGKPEYNIPSEHTVAAATLLRDIHVLQNTDLNYKYWKWTLNIHFKLLSLYFAKFWEKIIFEASTNVWPGVTALAIFLTYLMQASTLFFNWRLIQAHCTFSFFPPNNVI